MSIVQYLRRQKRESNSDSLKSQLDHSSVVNRSLGLIFVTLLMYVSVTLVSVTDLMLLKGDAKVLLPLLNIPIPIKAFFLVTPLILLGFHVNVLLHLLEHSRKLFSWIDANYGELPAKRRTANPFLFNFVIFHLRDKHRNWSLDNSLAMFLVNSVGFYLPIVILLAFQLRFSDYQSQFTTLFHMAMVIVDLLLVFILRPSILYQRSGQGLKASIIILVKKPRKLLLLFMLATMAAYSVLNMVFVVYIVNRPFDSNVKEFMMSDYEIPRDIVSDSSFLFVNWRVFWYRPKISVPETNLMMRDYDINQVRDLMEKYEVSPDKAKDSVRFLFGEGLNLKYRQLNYADLRNCVLDHVDLRGAKLRGARLEKAKLKGARIEGANFQGADLLKAELSSVRFIKVNLAHSNLEYGHFHGVYFHKVNLRGTKMLFAKFDNCTLDSAQFNQANLFKSKFLYSDISNTEFDSVQLSQAYFKGLTMSNTHIEWADLSGVQMDSVNIYDGHLNHTNLSGASLCKVSARNAHINNAILKGLSFDSGDLSDAFLIGTDLTGAILSYSRLNGCHLDSSILSRATLHQTSMEGVSLHWADLAGVNLAWVSLSGAVMSESDLSHSKLSNVNLSFSILRGAVLRHSKLSQINLQGADLSFASMDSFIISNGVLDEVELFRADMRYSTVIGGDFKNSNLSYSNMSHASVVGVNFYRPSFSNTTLSGSDFHAVMIVDPYFYRTDFTSSQVSNSWLFLDNIDRDEDSALIGMEVLRRKDIREETADSVIIEQVLVNELSKARFMQVVPDTILRIDVDDFMDYDFILARKNLVKTSDMALSELLVIKNVCQGDVVYMAKARIFNDSLALFTQREAPDKWSDFIMRGQENEVDSSFYSNELWAIITEERLKLHQ